MVNTGSWRFLIASHVLLLEGIRPVLLGVIGDTNSSTSIVVWDRGTLCGSIGHTQLLVVKQEDLSAKLWHFNNQNIGI